jgi:hypothetical protein
MIEIISLKTYWYRESHDLKNREQLLHNLWIDQILLKSFRSPVYDIFSLDEKQIAIEFGDYLILSIVDDMVQAFAICVDYPSNKWDIWTPHKRGSSTGMIEISMIVSKVPGTGALLIDEIKKFSSYILLRKNIEITVWTQNPKLVKYYEQIGFITKKKIGKIHIRMVLPLAK